MKGVLFTVCLIGLCVLLGFVSEVRAKVLPKDLNTCKAKANKRLCRLCGRVLPKWVIGPKGKRVNVDVWSQKSKVVVVILKAPWCPICNLQLMKLAKIQKRLRMCGMKFLMLSPGPKRSFVQMMKKSRLKGLYVYDKLGKVARALGVWHPSGTYYPGVVVLDKKRKVIWEDLGRWRGRYNDQALLKYWKCSFYALSFAVKSSNRVY